MRYKAVPLSVRHPTTPRLRQTRRRIPSPDRRSRLREWLATFPILLLVPALVIPILVTAANSKSDSLDGRDDHSPDRSASSSFSTPAPETRTVPSKAERRRVRAEHLDASTLQGAVPTDAPPASTDAPAPMAAAPASVTPAPVPVVPIAPPAPSDSPAAPAPVGGDLQALVNATVPGGTINYTGTWNGALTIGKPLTIVGGRVNGSIRIASSNVTLRMLAVIGPQSSAYVGGQDAIYAEYVSGVTLDQVEAGNVGDAGIRLHAVTGFAILTPNIHDAVYAGIITTSSTDGLIAGGTVQRIGMNGSAAANSNNAYGIALTRYGFETPKSARITVQNVTVLDVPTWHGLDTHGGVDLVFEGNWVERTYRGIMITGVGAERVTVRGNTVAQASYIGIAVVDAVPYLLAGNTITSSPNIGIFVDTAACGALDGNAISGSATPVLDTGARC